MDISLYYPCDRCGTMPLYGEFLVRSEVHRNDRLWATSKTMERHGLCRPCFDRITGACSAAAQGLEDPSWPGLPAPVDAAPSDYAHCNFCRSALAPQAYGIDLVPMTTEFVRRSLYRHHGSIQQHRICRQCYTWCLTLIHEDPEVRGQSARAYESGFANWYQQVARDVWASGLIERDEAVVWNACHGAGRDFVRIALADTRFLPHDPSRVVFIEAGQGRTVRAIRALPESARSRVIIVARPDTIEEAMDGMVLGAGDVTVSPLSPEQVAGSLERVADLSQRKRHAGTGLTIYPDNEPGAHGLPSNTLAVGLERHDTPRGAFLRLRRFLRGYDRVGVDAEGNLRVVVYCPCEYAPRVSERIQMFLGDGTTVRIAGQGAPIALPGTAASAA
ncbi:MAG TPA: hypothetical protein VIK11_05190 [Tepidiformaceae bacterium]